MKNKDIDQFVNDEKELMKFNFDEVEFIVMYVSNKLIDFVFNFNEVKIVICKFVINSYILR